MSKATYSQVSTVVDEMIDATSCHFQSYAYACGSLGSIVSALVADLPKHKQLEVIRQLQHTTATYKNAK
jgi:hypothetical protein